MTEDKKRITRLQTLRVREIMRYVDRYAMKSVSAALMRTDAKVNEARAHRSTVEQQVKKLVMQADESEQNRKLNERDEALAAKLNKR